ncbi:hypothetical protein K456DRAFT_1741458 [Colletotrichum gloeosporioides 23]|nr:hypothetical protein K456DRAFT_1741458 [Colletotrichum gloeosporioides 23]
MIVSESVHIDALGQRRESHRPTQAGFREAVSAATTAAVSLVHGILGAIFRRTRR